MTTLPNYTSPDCPRAWEAMPWVLQGSATQEQNDYLVDHLAHCEACRAEFAQQSRLRLAMSLPSDVSLDAEAGLQRLLGRLDASTVEPAPQRARSSGWLTRALVAAVLLQAIGIGALGLKLGFGDQNASYRTLSQEALPVAAGAIRVVPDTSMTLADWNALLHALQLQVVGGPNDVGAYTVAPASTAPRAHDTLQQLRAARGVRLAEPVSDTP